MSETAIQREQYHHGDLKHSLVVATLGLIREKGVDRFSMADACKAAGVSKAAPYRHFSSREDLLESVVVYGFSMFAADMKSATQNLPRGSDTKIIKLGLTYVAFAIKEPELFRLMFGDYVRATNDCDEPIGKSSFQILLDEIIARTQLKDIDALMAVAFPLWTVVHGAAILTIDKSYERIYPDNNTEQMIADITVKLLAEYEEPLQQ